MEKKFIEWLREEIPPHPLLRLGPGDDAALLRLAGSDDCVVTVDLLSDHVDFELPQIDPRLIGRKALAVNLSDLAAMAAQPIGAVVALLVPQRLDSLELARRIYEGLLACAEEHGVAIAGGDTNSWPGDLVISVTAIGHVSNDAAFRRNGARLGDHVVVTGDFGGSILQKHLTFTPRIEEALWLQKHAEVHAGMDVSDGLSLDLFRLAEESGCGAVLEASKIPVSEAAQELASIQRGEKTALRHALEDGEDFELLLAIPAMEAERLVRTQPLRTRLTVIGRFVAERGLWMVAENGERRPLEPRGFEHQFDS